MRARPLLTPRCHNCRRQKTKCDYQRPYCGQCVKAKRHCEGYDHGIRIVHVQGPKQVRKKPDAARLPLLPVAPVYNAALWGGFQTQYLPPNGRTIDAFSWVINVNSLWPADISTVTKMASGALPLILVGQQRQDPRLVNNGLQAYGHSMKILSEALSKHQSKDQLVYNLLACIIMQSIEMMHTEAIYTSSWLAHLIGMMSLVLAIGPEAFQDRFHSIFLYCRMYIIVIGMCLEQPVFLAQEPWVSVPFALSAKDAHTKLFDTLAHLPGALHLSRRLASHSTQQQGQTMMMEQTLISVHGLVSREFTQWYAELDLSWHDSIKRRPSCEWPYFALEFQNVNQAHLWLFYWMGLLTNNLVALHASAVSEYFCRPADPEPLVHIAESIIASVGYCTAPENGAMSTMFYIRPLDTVRQFLFYHGMDDNADLMEQIALGYSKSGFAVTTSVVRKVTTFDPGVAVHERMSRPYSL